MTNLMEKCSLYLKYVVLFENNFSKMDLNCKVQTMKCKHDYWCNLLCYLDYNAHNFRFKVVV